MSKTVVAIFDDYRNAEKAAQQIKDNGLRTDDISIVAKQREGNNNRTADSMKTGWTNMTMNAAGTGAVMGAESKKGDTDVQGVNDNISDGVMTGGILGGLAGLLIGAGSLAIPGLGIVAAAGPITGLLSGAITGGIVGGLVDLGIPENRSRKYEEDIKSGKILFSMRTDEDKVDKVASILRNNGAESVNAY